MSVVEKVGACLEANCNVVFAYVYGSYARGMAGRFSDLDIAVFLRDSGHQRYMELLSELPVDIDVEVDVRVLNDAPPFLDTMLLGKESYYLLRIRGFTKILSTILL